MEKIKSKINPGLVSVFYAVITGIIFATGFMLIKFPQNAGEGVVNGIEICIFTLIPSMYPFMFLVSFLFRSGLMEKSAVFLRSVTERLFGLPCICGPVIFFSMIGGLPLGGKMVEELYSKGHITEKQGQRMLFFCINPGPSFVIVTVGYYMLSSEKIGMLLYASAVISSLIIGMLSSLVWNDPITVKKFVKESEKVDLRTALVDAVSDSVRKMINICSWVVLFSCFVELIELLPVEEGTKCFLYAITEITNGCRIASARYPLPLIAGIIGFSGICAHMQIVPSIVKLKLELKYFMSARVLNAALSVLIFMVLSDMFDISVETVAFGSVPETSGRELSMPACVGFIIMSVLLMLGDNYRIRKRKEKRN